MSCNCRDCCKHFESCEIFNEFSGIADEYFLAGYCKHFEHKDESDVQKGVSDNDR